MDLTFNPDAKAQRTKEAYNNALSEISDNLKNGNKITHLYIDKEVAADVRSMLNDEFKRQGKEDNFNWGVVRRSRNEFSRQMQDFTGETIGDQKHYKLCYSN